MKKSYTCPFYSARILTVWKAIRVIEIRIHGMGGQGAVTAAEVIAVAAFHDGKYSQAFPFFGVERRGAPVTAFARIDDRFIRLRAQVSEPDVIIVLEPGMSESLVFSGLKENGTAIINTTKNVSAKQKTFTVDATKIALETIGKPIVNTAILGAFAAATGLVTLESLKKALAERFSGKLLDSNIAAVERTYNSIKGSK